MQRKGCQNPSRQFMEVCLSEAHMVVFFFFVCSTTSPWTGSVNRRTRPWMYRNYQKLMDAAWARCPKKTGISHSHLRIYQGSKKTRCRCCLNHLSCTMAHQECTLHVLDTFAVLLLAAVFSRDSGWPICDETWPCFVWATSQCITYIHMLYYYYTDYTLLVLLYIWE